MVFRMLGDPFETWEFVKNVRRSHKILECVFKINWERGYLRAQQTCVTASGPVKIVENCHYAIA